MKYTHIIYKFAFLNNKIYVGQTCQDFDSYMNNYKNNSLNKNKKDYNRLINKAIRKYGWDKIKKEIICTVSEEFVDDAERYYIKLYNSNNKRFGYNIEDGGNKNKHLSEETKEKIKNNHVGMRGKKHTIESKKLMRNIKLKKYVGQNHPQYGKKQSKEHIKNHAKSCQKSINVYTKAMKYIKTFESIKQAEIELNVWHQNIVSVLKNKRKSAGGYIFKYNNRKGIL